MRGIVVSRLITLAALLLVAGQAGAQTTQSPHPLFADQAPLSLKITGPFRALARDSADDRPERPALLEFSEPDGRPVALDMEIRIRGNSRVAVCDRPPLSLQIKGDAEGTVFEGQDRLKLVVLCKSIDRYRDYLAEEFLIYRMLNALTDESFRVRWASVEYVYNDTKREESVVEPAFLIEEDWEAAERLGAKVVEVPKIAKTALDAPHSELLALFQYLIGNTDWALIDGPGEDFCCHNGKVIGKEGEPLIVLPYDFDGAGMINTDYAAPAENLSIRYVTQRLYRGFCIMNDEIDGALAVLNGQRERLKEILDDPRVSERSRERAIKWLDDSFEILNDPKLLQKRIYDDCRPGEE